jgi:sulfur carrier protein
MQVIINNKEKDFRDGDTLLSLLTSEQINSVKGIAVAVDGNVIPRNKWNTHQLKAGNQILIIKAAQGG